jgi:predicted alpha/beta-fold hydrolase
MRLMRTLYCVAAAALCLNFTLVCAEQGDEGDGGNARPRSERGADGLPKFRHPYKDGLYSTVTAVNTFPDLEVKAQKRMKLKVPGFKKDVTVYAVLQNYRAPLVVVLLGVDGKVDGPWGCLFPYWYNEYNYNVLTFDNSFTPGYADINGQGVVGNFDAESDQAAAVIDAFLKTDEAKKSVTDVAVIGMSFGGIQALQLAKKDAEGKLPFKLNGCLAISPPVKLKTAARTVDKFFHEDRWDTTMVELAKKFGAHVPVEEGQKTPFTATEMRAAIGYVFRDGLTKVVERNDRAYKLKLLPSEESGEHRGTYAEAVGFEKFINEYTFPFWEKKGAVKSPEELWSAADLEFLLPKLPDYAEAIVAADDPFTTPDELAQVKAIDRAGKLTVLPHGGHLGFIASDWMLVKSLRVFGGRLKPDAMQIPDDKPDDKKKR